MRMIRAQLGAFNYLPKKDSRPGFLQKFARHAPGSDAGSAPPRVEALEASANPRIPHPLRLIPPAQSAPRAFLCASPPNRLAPASRTPLRLGHDHPRRLRLAHSFPRQRLHRLCRRKFCLLPLLHSVRLRFPLYPDCLFSASRVFLAAEVFLIPCVSPIQGRVWMRLSSSGSPGPLTRRRSQSPQPLEGL